MAGTIRGKIECRSFTGNGLRTASEIWKNAYDFLESHPSTVRKALGYGTGTGVDFWDGANPAGKGALAVWEWTVSDGWTFWVLLWCNAEGVTNTYGGLSPQLTAENVSQANGYAYTCIQVCAGLGGDANPYKGSLNNDGTDTLPAYPIWGLPNNVPGTGDAIGGTAPSMTLTDAGASFTSALVGSNITITGATTGANNGTFTITAVGSPTELTYANPAGVVEAYTGSYTLDGTNYMPLPTSNRAGASSGTNANEGSPAWVVYFTSTDNARYHFMADDDFFFYACDEADDGVAWRFLCFGAYEANPNISQAPMRPLFMLNKDTSLATGSVAEDKGGIVNPLAATTNPSCLTYTFVYFGSLMATAGQPNELAGYVWEPQTMPMYTTEVFGYRGYVGRMPDFMSVIYGVQPMATDIPKERIAIGDTKFAYKPFVPWDGATTPGTGVTRAGVTWTR